MEENQVNCNEYEYEVLEETNERPRAIVIWFYGAQKGIVITKEIAGELIKDLIVFLETN